VYTAVGAWRTEAHPFPYTHMVETSRGQQLSTVSTAAWEFVARCVLTLVVRDALSTLVAIPNWLLTVLQHTILGGVAGAMFPSGEIWLHLSVFFR